MRFLVDAQLPPALARLLTDRGHTAEHVNDIGLGDAADRVLWVYALDHECILVTKDEDFLTVLPLVGGGAPVVVWVRMGNARRKALLDWFEPLIDRIAESVTAGNRVVELR